LATRYASALGRHAVARGRVQRSCGLRTVRRMRERGAMRTTWPSCTRCSMLVRRAPSRTISGANRRTVLQVR
jgi:hypothetical protein